MTGTNLQKLQDIEGNVFGSAASEQGSASAVKIRIGNEQIKPIMLFRKESVETVPKHGRELKQPSGRDYLYWSMDESGTGSRDKYQPPKKYMPEGSSFQLVLSSRFIDEDALQKAVASLWMLVHFGGVGSRSRRTAGSLSADSSKEFEGLNFQLQNKTPLKIAEELLDGLKKAQKLMRLPPKTSLATPAFDVISLEVDTFQSWVLGPWDSSTEAVTAIGSSLRDFRTYSQPDHDEVYKWLNGSAISTVTRSAFGLPIPYKYSSGNKPQGVIQGKKDKIERRASPLWLKVSKTANGKYVVVATLFKSIFLPKGEQISATGVKNETGKIPPPISPPLDYTIIEDWISTTKKDSTKFKQVAEVA
jgi:CRISPR-associated protein Cmr1